MGLKSIKFRPVAWMTTVLGVLVAVEAVNEGAHLLPAAWSPWLLGAIAALTAVLGRMTHDRVTPLARPRDAADTPLVPKSMAGPAPSGGARDIGSAGMHGW